MTIPGSPAAATSPIPPKAEPSATDAGQATTASLSASHDHAEDHLAKPDLPERLNRQNHYLICGHSKLVATWENNGQGWSLNTGHGMVNAARNQGELPSQGDFRLVELQFAATDHGRRLTGIRSFQLAPRWALPALARGDHDVMAKIAGPAGLDRAQKNLVRGALRDQFMAEVWHESHEVLEYLANTDYHSPGAGSAGEPSGAQ